jgi:hypothetical protein
LFETAYLSKGLLKLVLVKTTSSLYQNVERNVGPWFGPWFKQEVLD